ncbi:protein translocase subunit SecD [Modestobacter sp. KNN46-3]|jgi:preprotein translocase subunit SecD|uniref:protein translocase subunit SecD n=1 Tax=Modestobacter sp. KNN46-3 TaxID=2711218 RepID=UPI0013E0257B|nr:protein translocase subunit SecD [Modestobacter sp. KNN46-3]
MAARQLPARRYFAAFLAIVAGLYALVFLTGDQRTPQLGLDLQGGTTVTLAARTPDGQAPDQEDLELARQIIEQRVNGLGVAEAEVVTEGESNIVISVPGDDGERARELGATAQLRFRPVLGGPEPAAAADPEATDPAATDPAATDPEATDPAATDPAADPAATDPAATEPAVADPDAPAVTQEEAIAEYATLTCDTTTTEVDQPDSFIAACSDDGAAKFLLGPAVIEGTDVADATSGTDVATGEWVVNLDFTSAGSAAWAEYTTANVGNNVAITLDGRVVSAPTINSAIAGGTTQITGSFDQAAATELANQLRYGALPLTFSEATAQSITTELGSEQLRAGLIAGAIGVALVFVYALLYYRLLGLVMIASLVLSAVVIYACLVLLSREIGLALSLAGIAGFIVSIGITADSFVVYFERLKDEVREGRSLRSATPRAWVRARRTILSADAVSFLAAAILYWLAIGDVKGFAFTLGLSTVLDLIVVFLFTHPLMAVLSRVKGFGSNRFSGLGQVDHSRRPAGPPLGDRELVGAATGSSTNGSNR